MDLEVPAPLELSLPMPQLNADEGSHMAVLFGLGHSCTVYVNTLPGSAASQQTPDVQSSTLHNVVWAASMHDNQWLRRLVSEGQHIFTSVQQRCAGNDSEPSKDDFLKFSLEYRALMRATRMDLTAAAELHDQDIDSDDSTNSEKQYLEAESQLMSLCELLWHLCEVMFINIYPEKSWLLLDLVDWLRLQFPQGQIWAEEAASSSSPSEHPHFWDALSILVLQGCTTEAASLLSLHQRSASSSFKWMSSMLRGMPKAKFFSRNLDFSSNWDKWKQHLRISLDTGEYIDPDEPRLEQLARLLNGEEDELMKMETFALVENAWYHIYISKLLLNIPTMGVLGGVADHAREFMQTSVDLLGMEPSSQDELVLLALCDDVSRFIRTAAAQLHSWWFVAHLTDLLLYTVPPLAQCMRYGHSTDLREYYLLEYAQSLFSNPALWQVALVYLDACPVLGRGYSSALLSYVPLTNERKALHVYRACQSRDLLDESNTVCRVMWKRNLRLGQLCVALAWAVRGRDVTCVSQVAELFLSEPQRRGRLSLTDALDCLGSAELLSNHLAFLVRYRDFHRLLEAGRVREAAGHIVALLSSGAVARRFWPGLLLDVLPLLPQSTVTGPRRFTASPEEYNFTSEQVTQLMRCLQELMSHHKDVADKLSKDESQLLRIGLAKALSKAMMCEASVSPVASRSNRL